MFNLVRKAISLYSKATCFAGLKMRSHCLCYICIFHTSKGAVLFFVEKHGVGRGDTNNVEWKAGDAEVAADKVIPIGQTI